ncbi:MAG TPA: hypothetical protein VEU33_45260 [Archangium sp.]|nr:hypothetical protein [Archangium sp.]
MTGPSARMTARSMAFSSSRTLPGQGCEVMATSASGANVAGGWFSR